MSRKPLVYTSEFPYHVVARSNNKEWFYLPQDRVWEIFVNELNKLTKNFKIKVHAFVLMTNHYHLLVTMSEEINLGDCMQLLQKSVSRRINSETGRINHVFGGPYKGCLISSSAYYHHVLKYVLRNPVKAEIVLRVEDYEYSTIFRSPKSQVITSDPDSGIESMVPQGSEFFEWLNVSQREVQNQIIKKNLRKPSFKVAGFERRSFY